MTLTEEPYVRTEEWMFFVGVTALAAGGGFARGAVRSVSELRSLTAAVRAEQARAPSGAGGAFKDGSIVSLRRGPPI